jgi:hypothetical protein
MVVFAAWASLRRCKRPDFANATGGDCGGASFLKDKRSARVAIVEQHIRLENEHDLEGVLNTFVNSARYDDEPWAEHYTGRNGVGLFYQQLMRTLPDLEIEVQRR